MLIKYRMVLVIRFKVAVSQLAAALRGRLQTWLVLLLNVLLQTR